MKYIPNKLLFILASTLMITQVRYSYCVRGEYLKHITKPSEYTFIGNANQPSTKYLAKEREQYYTNPSDRICKEHHPLCSQSFPYLPLTFTENRGQLDERIAFHVQGRDTAAYFTAQGMTLAFTGQRNTTAEPDSLTARLEPGRVQQRWNLKLDFLGANPKVRPEGRALTSTNISYFNGPPTLWRTGLPSYGEIVYRDLWPGIDLVYGGTVNRLKYQFIVRPGADPNLIRLAYRGPDAPLKVNRSGRLEIVTPLGTLRDDKPVSAQGERSDIKTKFVLHGKTRDGGYEYGFRVAKYDHSQTLVIDPALLVYSGLIGGSGDDEGHSIAVDSAGNAYITGVTTSPAATFPETAGPDLTYNGRTDAFVAKIKADGSGLAYAGYLGGEGDDEGHSIAVDAQGNAYVTGLTTSFETSFPVKGGPDLSFNGAMDAFVAKINPTGTALVYCGYVGGDDEDEGLGVAVDGAGRAYLTGLTASTETTFPKLNGPKLTFGGAIDAFVARVKADGSGLEYAGYLGGSGDDQGRSIAVDVSGNAYIAGQTTSTATSFPMVGTLGATHKGGTDAFVAKLNADGTAVSYSGFLGGSGIDEAYGLAVDGAGAAYVTGRTTSTEATFPHVVGPDASFNGDTDAFVAKINAAGSALSYAGYIGGAGRDEGFSIAVDRSGNAYLTGLTTSVALPVSNTPNSTYKGGTDGFVAKVAASGAALQYLGYVGGSGADEGFGSAVDASSLAYFTGRVTSADSGFVGFGTAGQPLAGTSDAFVIKLSDAFPGLLLTALTPNTKVAGSGAFRLTVTGTGFSGGSVVNWNGIARPTTFGSASQLTAAIPASDVATVGVAKVTISDDGTSSNAVDFTITAAPNPVPTLASLAPSGAVVGSPALTLVVRGTGFVSASKVLWNGTERATTVVSATEVRAALLVTDLAQAGVFAVMVITPAPGGGVSNPLNFNVTTGENAVPVITAGAALARQQGSAATTSVIATVSDRETPAGNLLVTATATAGLIVTDLTNDRGAVSAKIGAACNARVGLASVVLTVRDEGGKTATATLKVNVTENTPPVLKPYPPLTAVRPGGTLMMTPAGPPSDNGEIVSLTASAPGFTGRLDVDPATGKLTVTNAGPVGTYAVTIKATDACGATTKRQVELAVSAVAPCGTLAFQTLFQWPIPGKIKSLFAPNLNPSGWPTFVTLGETDDKEMLFRSGSGEGNFNPLNSVKTTLASSGALFADVNGDERADLIVYGNDPRTGGKVEVRLHTGGLNFAPPVTTSIAGRPLTALAADFNHDGREDLAVVTYEAGGETVWLLLSEGNGQFKAPVSLVKGLSRTRLLEGDFNADGFTDVTVLAAEGTSNADRVIVLTNSATTAFTTSTPLSLGSAALSAVAGDFNGDARADLALSVAATGSTPTRLLALLAKAAGGFEQLVTPRLSLFGMAVGDFNGDGKLDLVGRAEAAEVAVLVGDGGGAFSLSPVQVNVSGKPDRFLVGDFNKDGKPDIVALGSAATVLLNRCSSATNTAPTIEVVKNLSLRRGETLNVTLGTVRDKETAAGNLTLSAEALPAGLSLSNLANREGTITATLRAAETMMPGIVSFRLVVKDGGGLTSAATVEVKITGANTPPTLKLTQITLRVPDGATKFYANVAIASDQETAPASLKIRATTAQAGVQVFAVPMVTNGTVTIGLQVTTPCGLVGAFPVVIEVTDGEGQKVAQTVNVDTGLRDLTGRLSLTSSALQCNNDQQTCSGVLTVKNLGTEAINGLLHLRLSQLPSGVRLIHHNGLLCQSDAIFVLMIPAAGGLKPGQQAQVKVQFANPKMVKIEYGFKLILEPAP